MMWLTAFLWVCGWLISHCQPLSHIWNSMSSLSMLVVWLLYSIVCVFACMCVCLHLFLCVVLCSFNLCFNRFCLPFCSTRAFLVLVCCTGIAWVHPRAFYLVWPFVTNCFLLHTSLWTQVGPQLAACIVFTYLLLSSCVSLEIACTVHHWWNQLRTKAFPISSVIDYSRKLCLLFSIRHYYLYSHSLIVCGYAQTSGEVLIPSSLFVPQTHQQWFFIT